MKQHAEGPQVNSLLSLLIKFRPFLFVGRISYKSTYVMSSPQNADYSDQAEWEMTDWHSWSQRESGLRCRELILVYYYLGVFVMEQVRRSCVRITLQTDHC